MKSKCVNESPEKTFVLIFDEGDETISTLRAFAAEEVITAGRFTAIAAFREVTIGYFDLDTRQYKPIPFQEQMEVLSMLGDIACKGDVPEVHAHGVLRWSEFRGRYPWDHKPSPACPERLSYCRAF